MRVTKFMGLAVVLVAMAVMVNTLAFKTAQVTNGLSLTVDTTGNAELAVSASASQDPGISTAVSNGKFTITIADVMQPDSVYTYTESFVVTNSSASSITLTCSASGFTGGVTADLLDTSNASLCGGTALAAAGSQTVRIRVTVPAAFVSNGGTLNAVQNASIVLTGTR